MYIYESHIDGLYTKDELAGYEDLYCEVCGDSDHLVGCAENRKEAWELFEGELNINGSGGWDYDYVKDFINSIFEK